MEKPKTNDYSEGLDLFHVAYPEFLNAKGNWASIGLFMKHLKNVCNYQLGKERKVAKEVLMEQEASKPKGKAKEPVSLGSTVPLTKFFTPLQRSAFLESDILAKKLNFTMEPGTPVGKVLNAELKNYWILFIQTYVAKCKL
ncbi:hypothetical protein K7432_015404 [Basidiobolus ranarum]|uniref:Uncharacterized protein n=1 Tax=Basidiobolus ranarum TaxID=34480 RepID=A0ABR2VP46_9FUNG